MTPQPNSPQVRVVDIFLQFSESVSRLNERMDLVVIPDSLMEETNQQARLNRLRMSPERHVVRSLDISPQLMRPFQALLRDFIDLASSELEQRGVEIPELNILLSYYGPRREIDRSTLLSPAFARALNVVLNHPALRSVLVDLEQRLMNRQRHHYMTLQQSCSDQSESNGRLFVVGVDRYILDRMVERTTVRATHRQLVTAPEPLTGKDALLVYAKGQEMLYEMERQRTQRLRSRIADLFQRPDPGLTSPPPPAPSPAEQALRGVPDTELVQQVFPSGRLTQEASQSLAEAMGPVGSQARTEQDPLEVLGRLLVAREVDPDLLPTYLLSLAEASEELQEPISVVSRAVSRAWHEAFGGSMLIYPTTPQGYPRETSNVLNVLSQINTAMQDLSQVPFGDLTLAMDAALAEASILTRRGHEVYEGDIRGILSSVFASMGIDVPITDEMVSLLAEAVRYGERPYEWVSPRGQAESGYLISYTWSDVIRSGSMVDLLSASEIGPYHPIVLAFRALGYDYSPEQVREIIQERILRPSSTPLTVESLSHLPTGLAEQVVRLASAEEMSLEDLQRLAYELVNAYGQEDVYSGPLYVLLPAGGTMRAYSAQVRDLPLPRLSVDLGLERQVTHPHTEGLLWRGENIRRVYEHVMAGNPVLLTERQLKELFRDMELASREASAIAQQMSLVAQSKSEGSYAAGRHAVHSDVMDVMRNIVGFLFEGMEMEDVDQEDPYDTPPPETVLGWDADVISSQVMYRRRIGRGRSERVVRGQRRVTRDIIPEQLLVHEGGEAERRARALMRAMEQLERRGEYIATGPMGSLVQVQDVDEQGNLVIRELTLEEYLRTVAPGVSVSPLPARALQRTTTEAGREVPSFTGVTPEYSGEDVVEDPLRAELISHLARRADYGVILPGADLVWMFHAIENAYSRALQEYSDIPYILTNLQDILDDITVTQEELDWQRLFQSLTRVSESVESDSYEHFRELVSRIREFREAIFRNLQEEFRDLGDTVITERQLMRLANKLVSAYPQYAEHDLDATADVFRRFLLGVASETLGRSDIIDRAVERVVLRLASQEVVPVAPFTLGVKEISQALGISDKRGFQLVSRYLYRELVRRGSSLEISDLVLRRLTGLTRNELSRLSALDGSQQQPVQFTLPLEGVPPRVAGVPTRELAQESTSPAGTTQDLQLELPIFLPESRVEAQPSHDPQPWVGSQEMLEALGLSETNLYGARRRRFLQIFGWGDEISSERRTRLRERRPEFYRIGLKMWHTPELVTREERITLSALSAAFDMYAPEPGYLETIETSALFNPANFAVARALYHLITDDPKSRLSIALRRAYLGAVASQESGLDTLTDLGLAAFQFVAEFVRTTPPGTRVGNLGIMPSDPDEVAQFLHEHLLELMIRHAARRTSREEAFSILREISLDQPLTGDDEEARTLGDVIADQLTVRSPEHGGPALSEDLAGQESAPTPPAPAPPAPTPPAPTPPAPTPPAPARPRPSRFELQGYVSPNRLEGGISEAIRRQEETLREYAAKERLRELARELADLNLREQKLSKDAASIREQLVESNRKLRASELRKLSDKERKNRLEGRQKKRDELTATNQELERLRARRSEIQQTVSGILAEYPKINFEQLVQEFVSEDTAPDELLQTIREGMEALARGDTGDFVEIDLEDPNSLSRALQEVGEGDEGNVAPEPSKPTETSTPAEAAPPEPSAPAQAAPPETSAPVKTTAAPAEAAPEDEDTGRPSQEAPPIALDMVVNLNKGAFLYGVMFPSNDEPNEAGIVQTPIRLFLSDVDRPLAYEQLLSLIESVMSIEESRQAQVSRITRALGFGGLDDDLASSLHDWLLHDKFSNEEIASRLMNYPGVILPESEAISRYAEAILSAYESNNRMVVQDFLSIRPFLVELLIKLGYSEIASRLQSINVDSAKGVNETTSFQLENVPASSIDSPTVDVSDVEAPVPRDLDEESRGFDSTVPQQPSTSDVPVSIGENVDDNNNRLTQFTLGYLRHVSNVLSDIEAGRISAEEARRALRGVELYALGGHVTARLPLYVGEEEIHVTVFPGGRVSIAGRMLALEERDPYPIAPQAVNPIPQQVMHPVQPSQEPHVPALIWVRHDARSPGVAMDTGLFENLQHLWTHEAPMTALDIETDPETNAFLQGALVSFTNQPGSDSGPQQLQMRLFLSDVDRYMAYEQLFRLLESVRGNSRQRASQIVRVLGLSKDVYGDVESLLRRGLGDAGLASRLMEIPGVILPEREAIARYAEAILSASEAGNRVVVQNIAFDIPYLVERLRELDNEELASRLQRINLNNLLDVAEMASVAGYGQVNLEHLGRRLGVLGEHEREAHLALEDAILTAQVEQRLQRQLENMQFERLDESGQYLVGLGPGRLYDISGAGLPEPVIGLRDRIFRVVQAGYSLDQMRAFMELEEVHFRGDEVVPVRRLRFEPMLDEDHPVQPMWQAQQELNRMFTAVGEEEARRIYQLNIQDAFRREVERILAPDLPPDMVARHGQLPSEYEREGIITSMMTLLRARAIAEGVPDPTDVEWVRETLNMQSLSDDLALHLVQRAAYYFTTPYSRDPRRQEVYRMVWEWWNQGERRERLGPLMSTLLERGMEQQLSWAEMTSIWRDVIGQEIERAGLPQVPVGVPSYRGETRNLYIALPRGGFAAIGIPMGISEQAQEEWLLHRVRTQLRRQAIAGRFGEPSSGVPLFRRIYESSVLEDVALLSRIEDLEDYEEVLRALAERRARAIQIQRLAAQLEETDPESAEGVDLIYRLQEHERAMDDLYRQISSRLNDEDYRRVQELRLMSMSQFFGELNRNRRMREALDDYILRGVLPVDTALRRHFESGEPLELEIPDRANYVSRLLEMAEEASREQTRVQIERYVPAENIGQAMEERWNTILQRARARNVAERIQQTLEELGVRGFRVSEADVSTRIPMHAAVLALHDAVSELAARGEAVTLSDITELMRQRLGTDVIQIGRYHRLDLTNPNASAQLVHLLRRSTGWLRRFSDEIDEDWIDYISRQMYRAYQLRGIAMLGASGVIMEQPKTTPFPIELYGEWVRRAWEEINPGAWQDIQFVGEADVGAEDEVDAGAGAGAEAGAGGGFQFGYQDAGGTGGWSGANYSGISSLSLSFTEGLLVAGIGIGAGYLWYRYRRRRDDDDEESEERVERRASRRGTGISGVTRFLVQANPFIRQPGHHISFDSDYRRPSQARLRRMERDMEGLL